MHRKKKLNFTSEELDALVEDVNSCVTVNNTTYSLALYPYHLSNVSESVKRLLNLLIAKYDQRLDGILLGYKNLKLITPYASLRADSCYIHVDIQGDFYIFKPKIGSILTGLVNRVSSNHIGCLVHRFFNVAVPYINEKEGWGGYDIKSMDTLGLSVTKLDLEGRLPYIQATVVSYKSRKTKIQNNTPRTPKKKNLSESDAVDNNNESLQEIDETLNNSTKKEKRKKRNSENIDDLSIKTEELSQKTLIIEETADTNKISPKKQINQKQNDSQHTNESDYFATPKIKKKQKQKNKTPEVDLEKGSLEDFVPKEKKNKRKSINEDTSITDSDKKKKGKKHEMNIEELQNTLLMEKIKSLDVPKKEKKRKSKNKEKTKSEEKSAEKSVEISDQKPINSSPVKPMADLEDRKIKKRRQSLSQSVNWENKELNLYDSDLEKTLNRPSDSNNVLNESIQFNLAKIQALNDNTPRKRKHKHIRDTEDEFVHRVKKSKNDDL